MRKRLIVPRASIIFILIAVFVQGCFRQAAVLPDSFTAKTLQTLGSAVGDSDVLYTDAQLDLTTSAGAYPARAVLIIKKPAYLRLELLPPIGPPDFFLAATPEKMNVLIPAKGEFYRGEPSGNILSRFFPWHFSIKEMVAIFAGTYPPVNEPATYRSYVDENTVRLEIKARSGSSQNMWLDSNNRLIKLVRFDESGNESYTVRFEDYREGMPLARKITITMTDGATSLTVRYSDLKIEKATDLSIFDLKAPEGFQTILLD